MTATHFVSDYLEVRIPAGVGDLESFREWARSDEFPENGRACYLGEIFADTAMEQLFTHNQVKTELTIVLGTLNKQSKKGTWFSAGASLTNFEADICTIPDGIFVKMESFQNKSVILCEGARSGFVELEGTPDMVLEIVSDGSVRKDKTELKRCYAEAGIPEYWLIDARKPPLEFTIFKLGESGYRAGPKQKDGWVKSGVFGESFRLTQISNAAGHPEFTLEVRN